MSYETKLVRAKDVIEKHNDRVNAKPISFDEFRDCLVEIGGLTDEALVQVSWEDLQGCGLPKLLAKQVAKLFRSSDEEKPKSGKAITEKRAQSMTPTSLLEHYDPRDPDNAVGKRLRSLSGGERCIVFMDDGLVDVEKSATLLEEIRAGDAERMSVVGSEGGLPRCTYRIGERPDDYVEENPLYSARVLRSSDGSCDQTNRSWTGVPQNVRVLLHLAVHVSREVVISSLDSAHNAMDLAVREDAFGYIASRYPKAALEYRKRDEAGTLPTLRVLRGTQRSNNPFGGHQRY